MGYKQQLRCAWKWSCIAGLWCGSRLAVAWREIRGVDVWSETLCGCREESKSFIPWGAGPRTCLGMSLAIAEMRVCPDP